MLLTLKGRSTTFEAYLHLLSQENLELFVNSTTKKLKQNPNGLTPTYLIRNINPNDKHNHLVNSKYSMCWGIPPFTYSIVISKDKLEEYLEYYRTFRMPLDTFIINNL